MKKFLFPSFSLFLYFALLFALLYYIFIYMPPVVNNSTTSPHATNKTVEKKSRKKELHRTKRVKKESKLTHVDFNKRLSALDAKVGDRVFIRIFKKEAMLEVWIKPEDEYLLFKRYPVCAFSGDLGPKLKEGDKQSPEGFYRVTKNLLNPKSRFHLAFNLGYPNAYDRAHKRTGSYLMVHGECVSVGCYAMTNSKIEEIYKLVAHALKRSQKYVQVHAFPFYMTDDNMARYENSKWYGFWTELKEGYDYFETERVPPEIRVENRHYTIYEANQ